MKSVALHNLGCKVNTYELDVMRQKLHENGYSIVSFDEVADIYIVNTCSVTNIADRKSRQMLHQAKKRNPQAVVVAVGCYAQTGTQQAKEDEAVDLIIGNNKKKDIVEILEQYFLDHPDKTLHDTTVIDINKTNQYEEMTLKTTTEHTRAYIKIQDGCNQFCSYCIIPYSRGRIRSKPLDELVSEITALAANGHQEIVLVGINLAFYGKEYGLTLADAVEATGRIPGVKRIRLGSLEPEMIHENDLVRLSETEGFCPQFHLSLQSGCDRTLKAMNRKYTSAEYTELVDMIRRIFPDASVTTDVMVGFPGETEEDFLESYEFVRKTAFSKIHVFPYSVRSGTKAASMPGQLSGSVKNERAARMAQLGAELEKNFLKTQVGKTVPVLFEKENCTSFHRGYSPNYTLVQIKRKSAIKSLRNSIFYVNIKESMNEFCIGEITDADQNK